MSSRDTCVECRLDEVWHEDPGAHKDLLCFVCMTSYRKSWAKLDKEYNS